MTELPTTVVVPTLGRPSLHTLLDALGSGRGPRPAGIVLVDDTPDGRLQADELRRPGLPEPEIVRAGGGGPARARNLGWRRCRTRWLSFLDDDVVPDPDWFERLAEDLDDAAAGTAGSQGRVRVPLPGDRRPTDWERGTAGLSSARWITADMTYRRRELVAVGGFDERFPRAYREDADLALRVLDRGGRLVRGRRGVTHPVRPAGWSASVRQQAGNADDVLMRRLHGRRWQERAEAPPGRRPRHLAVTGAAAAAAALAVARRPRLAGLAAAAWATGTAELAAARIVPGPRTVDEVARMAVTSVAIPPAATYHLLRGLWRHRDARPWRGLPELVLFDRDGTLVHDVPYNGDAGRVRVVAGAHEALQRLRAAGVRTGVLTNQSAVGRGLISLEQAESVNARVEELLGPFEVWRVCPHAPEDGCACRKPAPGMVKDACDALGVPPERCVVIGDIGSDVQAAAAAGAAGILVPTGMTRRVEVEATPSTAPDLAAAVDLILRGEW